MSAPAVESLTESQARRRSRIVDAAFELLLSQPYEAIQMRDIAIEADVALGTVYRYFTSKERLFSFVAVKWADRLDERLQRRPLKGRTDRSRLVELFSRSLHSFEQYPQFYEVSRMMSSSDDPIVKDNVRELTERTRRIYFGAVEDVSPADRETIVMCCRATMEWLLSHLHRGFITETEANRQMKRAINMLFGYSSTAAALRPVDQ